MAIVDYQGNAGLGIGSNPGISVSNPNDNLKVINDTSRDIMLLDSERNMRLYNQKLKERDSLTQMILQNQVSTKDIHEDYLPNFLNIKKDVEKAYNKWGGNPNDIKGYKEYQDSVTHLQDYAAHAQTNTTQLKQLQQQRAAETLPWKQKQLDKWIGQEEGKTKKDPWAQVNPYQQLFSFSIDPINKLYKSNTTSVSSADGLWKYDVTAGDYVGTLKNAQNEYLNNGETSEDMRQFFQKVEQYDPLQKKKFVEALNSQLDKYNQERGLQPDQPGYADKIDLVPGPDGIGRIKADPATFSAKYSLAQQEKYVSQGPGIFQKDYGVYQSKLADTQIKKAKLDIDWYNADTRRGMLNLKQRALKNMSDDEKTFSQTYDTIGSSVTLPNPAGNTLPEDETFTVNLSGLPQGATYIQGLGPDGKPIQLLPKGVKFSSDSKDPGIIRDKQKNIIGYKGNEGYYDVNYFVPAGTKIGKKTVDKDIQISPKDLYKLYQNSGYKGDFKDFVQQKFNGKQLDFKLEGSNGSADRVSSYVSQRALGNKATKKGQESPYGSDESDLMEPDAPESDN